MVLASTVMNMCIVYVYLLEFDMVYMVHACSCSCIRYTLMLMYIWLEDFVLCANDFGTRSHNATTWQSEDASVQVS